MSFTWGEIRKHYMNACEQATGAGAEFFDHATAAQRELFAALEEREIIATNTRRMVPKNEDAISWGNDWYSIYSVFNVTKQQRVEPEEAGMRGRERYLESTGRPPTGSIHRYHPEDGKLYLRDTADEHTELLINFKRVPPDVVKANLIDRPMTPKHLDYPLIYLTASHYYSMHPSANANGHSDIFAQKAWGLLGRAQKPKSEENRNRREGVQTWGYEF